MGYFFSTDGSMYNLYFSPVVSVSTGSKARCGGNASMSKPTDAVPVFSGSYADICECSFLSDVDGLYSVSPHSSIKNQSMVWELNLSTPK